MKQFKRVRLFSNFLLDIFLGELRIKNIWFNICVTICNTSLQGFLPRDEIDMYQWVEKSLLKT